MAFVDNGECPFNVSLAARHLDHLCDLLQFLTGKPFNFAGVVTEDTQEKGVIYHRFVPTLNGDFWAWAAPRIDYSKNEVWGGVCSYRVDNMPLAEHFAGLALHESKHILSVKHFNSHNSIMNNSPYHGHPYQANPMAADYKTLSLLFGPMAPLWPCAFDYGDLSLDKCVIHIPSIEWAEGSYAAIWLHGRQDNGKWVLEAESYDIQHQGYVGRPVASLKNDVLHIPLRYQGSTVEVVAPMIQFTGPSSKVRFEVSEIKPLHIHSASDWVH